MLLNPLCTDPNELQNHPEKHYVYHQNHIKSQHIQFSSSFWGRRPFSLYSSFEEFEKPQQIKNTMDSFLETKVSYLITLNLQIK